MSSHTLWVHNCGCKTRAGYPGKLGIGFEVSQGLIPATLPSLARKGKLGILKTAEKAEVTSLAALNSARKPNNGTTR